MDNIKTLKISLICSFVGIIGIFLLTTITNPKNVKIGEITTNDIDNIFTVCGNVTSHSTKNGHIFITLFDDKEITLVIFNTTTKFAMNNGLDLSKETICIEAQVDEYPVGSGNLELIYRSGRVL